MHTGLTLADVSPEPGSESRGAEQLRGLTEVSRALTYATTCDEVLCLAVSRAQDILAADATLIMLTEEEELVTVRSPLGAANLPLERLAEREKNPFDVNLSARLGCSPLAHVLAVPLVVGGAVTGLIAVALAPETTTAHEEAEWLLSALADQVAVAVEKMRLDEVASFRERLIGIVSHDLRTPISAISLAAQRLARLPDLPAKAEAMVDRIARSAGRAENMIRDLLDFTQIRLRGELTLTRQSVELASIAREAIDEINNATNEGRIHLRQKGPGRGMFDADRVAQVVGNLLANALAYGDKGRPIEVSVEDEPEHVSCKVHNYGAPITPSACGQIFEPMYQASAGTRPPGGGLGLGLFICRHIVEAHGGAIDVTSGLAEGTLFRIVLPRNPPVDS